MSIDHHVRAGERGRVRVFALDYQLSMEIAHIGTYDRLYRALGVDGLQDEDVQIVDIKALEELGLSGFLTEGYGVSEAEVSQIAETLDALQGKVAVIRSGAFQGAEVTLPSASEARLVAILGEPEAELPSPVPLESDSARAGSVDVHETTSRPPKSDARIGGMVATAVLVFLAIFVVGFVWMAG